MSKHLMVLGLFYNGATIIASKNKLETAEHVALSCVVIGAGAKFGATIGGAVGTFAGGPIGGNIVAFGFSAGPAPKFRIRLYGTCN